MKGEGKEEKREKKKGVDRTQIFQIQNEAASLFLIHLYTANNALQIYRYKLLQSLKEHSGRPLGETGKCLRSIRASTTHRLMASKGSETAPLPSRKEGSEASESGQGGQQPLLESGCTEGSGRPLYPHRIPLGPSLTHHLPQAAMSTNQNRWCENK